MDGLNEEELRELKYMYWNNEELTSYHMELLFHSAELRLVAERDADRMWNQICDLNEQIDNAKRALDPKQKRAKVAQH